MAHEQFHKITDIISNGSAFTILGNDSNGALIVNFNILASDNATVVKSGTGIFISALTNAGGGSGTVSAGSGGNLAYYPSNGTTVDDLLIGTAHSILGVNSSAASHSYYTLKGSNNASIVISGTTITINANTGSSVVSPGSSGNIAYYPANGTTVDDALISVTTGSDVAPLNLFINTSDVASPLNGDIWFLSSNNSIYLNVRSGNATYTVQIGAR